MSEKRPIKLKRRGVLILLAWLNMIGFDFLLHAGILAPLYREPHPFLLPMEQAFRLIPIGYASFLVIAVLLMWLMNRLHVRSGLTGFMFGLELGFLTWGAFCLGLYSISPAPPVLLAGWFVGQSIEMGLGGLVIGVGLEREKLGKLAGWVLFSTVIMIILGIVIQNVMGG